LGTSLTTAGGCARFGLEHLPHPAAVQLVPELPHTFSANHTELPGRGTAWVIDGRNHRRVLILVGRDFDDRPDVIHPWDAPAELRVAPQFLRADAQEIAD
jgi:hypothetical protein